VPGLGQNALLRARLTAAIIIPTNSAIFQPHGDWYDCGNRQSKLNDANPHDRIITAPDPSVFFDSMRASSA